MAEYIIDANILIEAHKRHYPLDVFISFWRKICNLANSGQIISIDKVKDEIIPTGDELSTWCIEQLPRDFFINTISYVPVEYANVIRTVNGLGRYNPSAIRDFADTDRADAFLIATVLSQGNTLVTEEISRPDNHNKVQIPDVCTRMSIRCVNTIQMFRELGITI